MLQDPDILNDHDTTRADDLKFLYRYNETTDKREFSNSKYEKFKKHYEEIFSREIDVQQYQPEVKQEWLNHFNTVLAQEKRFWHVDWIIKTTLFSAMILYVLNKYDLTEKFINKILLQN